MTHIEPTKSGGRRRAPDAQPRLSAHKREAVDSALIALCYWLMAQRLVEEAEAHGEFDCPDPNTHPAHPPQQVDGRESAPDRQPDADAGSEGGRP